MLRWNRTLVYSNVDNSFSQMNVNPALNAMYVCVLLCVALMVKMMSVGLNMYMWCQAYLHTHTHTHTHTSFPFSEFQGMLQTANVVWIRDWTKESLDNTTDHFFANNTILSSDMEELQYECSQHTHTHTYAHTHTHICHMHTHVYTKKLSD